MGTRPIRNGLERRNKIIRKPVQVRALPSPITERGRDV